MHILESWEAQFTVNARPNGKWPECLTGGDHLVLVLHNDPRGLTLRNPGGGASGVSGIERSLAVDIDFGWRIPDGQASGVTLSSLDDEVRVIVNGDTDHFCRDQRHSKCSKGNAGEKENIHTCVGTPEGEQCNTIDGATDVVVRVQWDHSLHWLYVYVDGRRVIATYMDLAAVNVTDTTWSDAGGQAYVGFMASNSGSACADLWIKSFRFVTPATSWSHTTVVEHGRTVGIAGSTAQLTLDTSDACGHDRHRGGDTPSVTLVGPDASSVALAAARVVDRGDGTYAVLAQPAEPGTYRVVVVADNTPPDGVVVGSVVVGRPA